MKRIASIHADLRLPPEQDIPLMEMDLSVRTYYRLKRAGYSYLSELAVLTHDDLMKIRNLGPQSVREIEDRIEALTGLKVPNDREDL